MLNLQKRFLSSDKPFSLFQHSNITSFFILSSPEKSSAGNLSGQFGFRSGSTERRS